LTLKHDPDFRKEAEVLDAKLTVKMDNGQPYSPTAVEDFDYLKDQDKDKKIKMIEDFCIKWNIGWTYWLLNYLIRGNKDDIPPKGNGAVAVGLNEEHGMFNAQVPLNADKEDMEVLWLMMQSWKRDLGIDIKKKPHKYTFNQADTEVAYQIWKMRRDGASWTKVTKYLNNTNKRNQVFEIKTAQQFLESNGFYF
jgi:hypothetical protein